MEKLFILDASGYLYRSYFAIRQMTNSKGESTNALFGFIRSLLKLFKDFQPTHLVSVFDGPNNAIKRTTIFPHYKAHRQSMPPDLLHQILWAQQFCGLMGIPELMIPNVEADDTMGSVAVWAADQGAFSYLCTSDKDMCQLVNDRIHILNTFKDNLVLGPQEVEKQFGVPPNQMIDYLAITGDPSDNVPGLSGFGPKTAASLLKHFKTLDYILDHPSEAVPGKKQDVLIQEREQVLISRRLVTVDTEVPFPHQEEFFRIGNPNFNALKEFYSNMNFNSLIRELEVQSTQQPLSTQVQEIEVKDSYQLIDNPESLIELVKFLSTQKEICIETETTSSHPLQAKLVGIGIGTEPGKTWYIPANGEMGSTFLVEELKPLLENPQIGFYGHNLKFDYHVLLNYGILLNKLSFDTMLASYLLNSHSRQHSLEQLILDIFGKVKTPLQELVGKGKGQISINDVPIDQMCMYCCEDVNYIIRLKGIFSSQIEEAATKNNAIRFRTSSPQNSCQNGTQWHLCGYPLFAFARKRTGPKY